MSDLSLLSRFDLKMVIIRFEGFWFESLKMGMDFKGQVPVVQRVDNFIHWIGRHAAK